MAKAKPGGRYEKSLNVLTEKFVALLQNVADGEMDLKKAAEMLKIKQMRRIYDVTNVLEGIGLIRKKSKNLIQYEGAGPGANAQEFIEKVEKRRIEVERLDQIEKVMDEHIKWMLQSSENITDEPSNKRYAYVLQEDLCGLFPDQTIIGLKVPKGTRTPMDAPDEKMDREITDSKIHLKAMTEPIYAYLVNPELESPKVIVDFPNTYMQFLEDEILKPAEVVEIEVITGDVLVESEEINSKDTETTGVSTSTTQKTRNSPGRSYVIQSESNWPRREVSNAKDIESTPIMSTRSQTAKRQQREREECEAKQFKLDDDIREAPVNNPVAVNAPDYTEVMLDADFKDIARTEEIISQDPEDDLGGEWLDGYCSTALVGSILRLSPPPTEQDYWFTLAKDEGLVELYDIGSNATSKGST